MARFRERMSRAADDRGAMLVHVALAVFVLLASSTLVADYGVLWASRRQAQNSADAAALAGAVALAYDNPTDLTATGPAKQSALYVSQQNLVWGQAPSVQTTTDVTFVTCPDGSPNCLRVDVYRNTARGNALPVFFGSFIGLSSQSIQATATAEGGAANATNCMMPWAIPDQFIDNNHNGRYDAGDSYVAPTTSSPGTGYTVASMYGTQLNLTTGPVYQLSPGWFQMLNFPDYEDSIDTCEGIEHGIGDVIAPLPGNQWGNIWQTQLGVDGLGISPGLIGLDPNAVWNSSTKKIENSCVQAGTCPNYNQSPRIVTVPVFDPAVFKATGQIKITNMIGFFVQSDNGNFSSYSVTGIVLNVPAFLDGSKGSVGSGSGFLKIVYLAR
jgi:Flp pilus assembly protein TadG